MEMLSAMQEKIWWKKERIELALVQIAGRCQQRPLWSGFCELIALSGGNILTFLSICQFIWDTQNQIGKEERSPTGLSEIDPKSKRLVSSRRATIGLRRFHRKPGRVEIVLGWSDRSERFSCAVSMPTGK